MKRRGLLLAAAGLAVAGCESDGQEPSGRVRIATGSTAAVYHAYGTAIARLARQHLPKIHTTVLVTAASAENVGLVLNGGAEVGFTQADTVGARDQESPGQLGALARLYDDYVHLVVRDDGAIRTINDLRDKRVSMGAPGSGTAITAERLLTVVGQDIGTSLRKVFLNLDESANALAQQRVDAFFFSGGLPVSAVETLAVLVPIQLLGLQQYVQPLRRSYGEFYAERVVPSSTYAGISPTLTIGIPNYLVVRTNMFEPLAYGLTKLLFDGREALGRAHPAGQRLNVRSAITTPPIPLHAGAARYYREEKR